MPPDDRFRQGFAAGLEAAAKAVEAIPNLLIPVSPDHVRGLRGSDCASAIRAIPLPEAPAGEGWRKMDSAPRDGTRVLLFDQDNDNCTVGFWSPPSGRWLSDERRAFCGFPDLPPNWRDRYDDPDLELAAWAIHLPIAWRHLPAPPQEQEG